MDLPVRQRVTLLGSTGSIGRSALQVLALNPERYEIHALSGNRNVDLMFEQIKSFKPKYAVMCDAASADKLRALLRRHGLAAPQGSTEIVSGNASLEHVAGSDDTDIVIAGIVGAAGLASTLSAAGAGKRILLANKEALVMCGELLMSCARQNGALIMPIDSEHNAIFQCLPVKKSPESDINSTVDTSGVEKIVLTASGGPFRGMTRKQLSVVSRQQALQHPNWSMGPKITVDSASMMNKGLEVIEACYLFAVAPETIEVVVHPQSVVHSLVRYIDGSVLAQLGQPDMRTPIAHALAWPERLRSGVSTLDLVEAGRLDFERPDWEVFPCLKLAFDALQQGGTASVILNAANEIAVEAFLNDRVAFIQLPQIIEQTMASIKLQTPDDLDTILIADREARQVASSVVSQLAR